MQPGKLVAISLATERGIKKASRASTIAVPGVGLEGDCPAKYKPHRQVSLLGLEFIQRMRDIGFEAGPGSFCENLTLSGVDLDNLPVGSRLVFGDGGDVAVLRVSHIGHVCMHGLSKVGASDPALCEQRRVYAVVESGGRIEVGQTIRVELPDPASGSVAA